MDEPFWSGVVAVIAVSLSVGCGSGPAEDDDDELATATPIPNSVPAVSIVSPENGSVVLRGEWVSLEADVSDVETAPEQLVVRWYSSLDGSLGESSPNAEGRVELEARFTSSGERQITVEVTDSAGARVDATFAVRVDSFPTAVIEGGNTDEIYAGWPVTFYGQVSDWEDAAETLDITWEAGGEVLGTGAVDALGMVSITTSDLKSGKQTISLTVTDTAGLSTSDDYPLTVLKCLDQDQDGHLVCDDDCDDSDASVYEGAVELCDGKDQDCNGINDNGWPDVDRDGIPDCLDEEDCDGIDNDGDGLVDEGFDRDEDGQTSCEGDCDDLDPFVFSGAEEVCDGYDNNCNSQVDEGLGDDFEPNDSIYTAAYLGDQDGDLDEVATYELEGTLHSPTDADWYEVWLEDDRDPIIDLEELDSFYIEVRLTNIPDGANYDLYLWWDDPLDFENPGEDVVAQSTNPDNDDEVLLHEGVPASDSGGDFYIEIRPVNGFGCVDPYTLYFENSG